MQYQISGGIYYVPRKTKSRKRIRGGNGQKHDRGSQKVVKGVALEFKGYAKPTPKVRVRQTPPPPRHRRNKGSYYQTPDQRGWRTGADCRFVV